MKCMNPLPDGAVAGTPCPVCGDTIGAANPPSFLQPGVMLSERYMVGRLLRSGGDAARYAGYDTVLKAPIVIREFWPDTLCERGADGDVRPHAGCEPTYEEYRGKFLAHARVVARMRDLPASIPTYDIFQQNNTAYTISERCDGETLESYLQAHGGRLSWEEARPLFIPLMTSLMTLHKAGVYHLGLCPENLILAEDGKLHIDGFAIPEARISDSELSPALESGYAAPEQYTIGNACGATTDVYGLAAVIFRTLVGNPPPDGETRPKANSDLTVPAEVAEQLPPHVAAALFDALQPSVERRTISVAALRDRLAEAPAVAALLDDEEEEAAPEEEPAEDELAPEEGEEEVEEAEEGKSRRTLYAVLLTSGVIVLLVVLAVVVLLILFPDLMHRGSKGEEDATPAITSANISIQDGTSAHAPNMMVSVPNVIGQKYADLRGKYVEDRAVLLGGLQYSDSVPEGIVISQSPESDKQADITEPVKVIVSAGPETISIPDVTGWPLDHAMAYMQALGFEVQVDDVGVSSQEAGCIDSTSPSRGSKLSRGSVIRLRVSTATTTTPPTTPPATVPPTTPPTTPPSRPAATTPPTTPPTAPPTTPPTTPAPSASSSKDKTNTTAADQDANLPVDND